MKQMLGHFYYSFYYVKLLGWVTYKLVHAYYYCPPGKLILTKSERYTIAIYSSSQRTKIHDNEYVTLIHVYINAYINF